MAETRRESTTTVNIEPINISFRYLPSFTRKYIWVPPNCSKYWARLEFVQMVYSVDV